MKLTTYYCFESEHARTIHTFTVVTSEWPYTPRQTALYYHIMFTRMSLPQPPCHCYSLAQLNYVIIFFDFSLEIHKFCTVHTCSSISQMRTAEKKYIVQVSLRWKTLPTTKNLHHKKKKAKASYHVHSPYEKSHYHACQARQSFETTPVSHAAVSLWSSFVRWAEGDLAASEIKRRNGGVGTVMKRDAGKGRWRENSPSWPWRLWLWLPQSSLYVYAGQPSRRTEEGRT